MDFLIIADDFTGAYDTAVQFQKRGIDIPVVFETKNMVKKRSCIIDTETRGLVKSSAYDKVRNIVDNINNIDTYDFYYKKVDSTLRGNIGLEILAIDEVVKFDLIISLPANPDTKRTVQEGILLLDNVSIKNSNISQDLRNAVSEDNLKHLLESQLGEEVIHIGLKELRSNSLNLMQDNNRIISFDTITNGDMDYVVKYILSLHRKTLWVGCAGLANAILHVMYPSFPVLCVVGSLSDISRNQVDYAISRGSSSVYINIASLIKGADMNDYINEAVDKIRNGKNTILYTARDKSDIYEAYYEAEKIGISKSRLFDFINNIIGEISSEIVERVTVSGVLLTGGDTALSFTRHNSNPPKILGELLPSVPLLLLEKDHKSELKVVIKGGHIGQTEVLHYCINKLREMS